MGVYEEIAADFAKDLDIEFGGDYTLEQLLRFQAQNAGLITVKSMGDYLIKKEFNRIFSEQKGLPVKDRLSQRKICIDIATRNNRSYQGIYLLIRDS